MIQQTRNYFWFFEKKTFFRSESSSIKCWASVLRSCRRMCHLRRHYTDLTTTFFEVSIPAQKQVYHLSRSHVCWGCSSQIWNVKFQIKFDGFTCYAESSGLMTYCCVWCKLNVRFGLPNVVVNEWRYYYFQNGSRSMIAPHLKFRISNVIARSQFVLHSRSNDPMTK